MLYTYLFEPNLVQFCIDWVFLIYQGNSLLLHEWAPGAGAFTSAWSLNILLLLIAEAITFFNRSSFLDNSMSLLSKRSVPVPQYGKNGLEVSLTITETYWTMIYVKAFLTTVILRWINFLLSLSMKTINILCYIFLRKNKKGSTNTSISFNLCLPSLVKVVTA